MKLSRNQKIIAGLVFLFTMIGIIKFKQPFEFGANISSFLLILVIVIFLILEKSRAGISAPNKE